MKTGAFGTARDTMLARLPRRPLSIGWMITAKIGVQAFHFIKGNIYGDIMGMMFGDAGSAWGHLYNFIDETKRCVGLGIDSMGASHFFIHTGYSDETPDVTPIKGLEMVSHKRTIQTLLPNSPQRMLHSRRHKAGLMQAAKNCPFQKRKIPSLKENLTI